jgi:serum/glucocorticoid-regulated kinase 1/serum/glucocorticoid-regulated kinase 2
MAPEVMFRQNHGIAADYFAVGVIGYEMMLGKRPYLGKTRKDIKDAIYQR